MINSYKIGKDGLELIKNFEGCKLVAYLCPAGVLTIGYGSTGKHVTKGLEISSADAEKLLKKDLKRFEEGVNALLKVPISQNEFDALVSFSYNVGLGNLKESTLLKLFNDNKIQEAAEEFVKWNKANKVVLAGLTARRLKEKALFLK